MPSNYTFEELAELAQDKGYPETDFGRPDGRDYHYRIPANSDESELAFRALNGRFPYGDRLVVECDELSGPDIEYIKIRTHDSKGHLVGLAKFAHSPRWRDAGVLTDIDEYRPAGGVTRVRGTFRASPSAIEPAETRLTFETTVDLPVDEFEDALDEMGETWMRAVQEPIIWAKDEALEEFNESVVERQRECAHDALVEDEDRVLLPEGIGYCEDCWGVVDEEGNVIG